MKQLSSFMAVSIDGGDRVGYTYEEVDGTTGEVTGRNKRGSFYAVDPALAGHIEAIRDYIRAHKLAD